MLTYRLDIEARSRWLRATPTQAVRTLGFFCTEAGVFYCKRSFATVRSEKNSYLLFYTFEGEGILEQDDVIHKTGPGTLLLLDCRRAHSYCTSSAGKWHFYWAHIDGAGVAGYFDLLRTHGELCHCVTATHAPLLDAWNCVLKNARQNTPEESLTICFSLHQILHLAAESLYCSANTQSNSGKEICHSLASYLRANYDKELRLDALAQRAALSKSYLIRLFRQNFGTTPYDYLLHYRITKAKELLSTTQLSVEAISDAVGFGSRNNFIVQFSRLCHQSPLQYRKSFWVQRTDTQ